MSLTFNGLNGLSFGDGTSQNTAASGFGFKNRIINGDMRIAQRGTVTGAGIDTYGGCDRWKIWCADGGESGRATMSQSTDAPAGFYYSQQIAVTTAEASVSSSHNFQLIQRIEALNLLDVGFGQSSKYFTVSFWAKSNKAGTYNVTIFFTGSSSNKVNVREVALTSTWTRYTLTFITDSTQAIGISANSYVQVGIGLMAGSQWRSGTTTDSWAVHNGTNWNTSNQVNFFDSTSNIINVTGVQFEKGSTATDFDWRPYPTERSLCQRYLEYGNARIGNTNAANSYESTSVNYKVTKRASPSVSFYNLQTNNGSAMDFGTRTNPTEGFFPYVLTAGTGYYYMNFDWKSECEL